MPRQQRPPRDPYEAIAALEARLRSLENSSQLGHSTARGGTARWADDTGAVDIWIGVLPDGSRGIKVGATSIILKTDGTITTSGAVATGPITTGTVTASGDISTSGRVVASGGVNTGQLTFKFVKTSGTRLDMTTS